MSSTDTESDREHILWEQGDSDISAHSYDSPSIEATVPSSQATSGLNTPMADIALSSQGSTAFFSSLPTSMPVVPKWGGIWYFSGGEWLRL